MMIVGSASGPYESPCESTPCALSITVCSLLSLPRSDRDCPGCGGCNSQHGATPDAAPDAGIPEGPWIWPNLAVSAITTLSTGAIVLGGQFESVTPTKTAGLARVASMSIFDGAAIPTGLVRLNADGTLDSTFNPGGTGCGGSPAFVRQVIQEHATSGDLTGRLLVSSICTTYNGTPEPSGVFRLAADGTLDTTYNSGGAGLGAAGSAYVMVEEPAPTGGFTGKLLIGGSFNTFNGTAIPAGLARVDSTGAIDASV